MNYERGYLKQLEPIVREKEAEKKIFAFKAPNGIPVIFANGNSLAEAWENSLIALYYHGCNVKTQYDNPKDPPSIDCTMIMTIENPFAEPVIHRCFPGGLEDLEEYKQEVCDGIKDFLIGVHEESWQYTYHERLKRYDVPGLGETIDQLKEVVEKLAEVPFTRRAQAITWQPWKDNYIIDPPCLQRFWFRILEINGEYYLNTNMDFRSRDAYKAAFMNDFAFIHLIKNVAEAIEEKLRKKGINKAVKLGRFVDKSDSYHIYGKDIQDFEKQFIENLFKRNFQQRTWTLEFANPFFEEAQSKIKENVDRLKADTKK